MYIMYTSRIKYTRARTRAQTVYTACTYNAMCIYVAVFVLLVSVSTRVDVCCVAPASSLLVIKIITIYTYYTGCTIVRVRTHNYTASEEYARGPNPLHATTAPHLAHKHTGVRAPHSLSINVTGHRLRRV